MKGFSCCDLIRETLGRLYWQLLRQTQSRCTSCAQRPQNDSSDWDMTALSPQCYKNVNRGADVLLKFRGRCGESREAWNTWGSESSEQSRAHSSQQCSIKGLFCLHNPTQSWSLLPPPPSVTYISLGVFKSLWWIFGFCYVPPVEAESVNSKVIWEMGTKASSRW